jgi:NAD(P)-dependent dehydrogenase (short-subunit alcohol dehydrogenase family)
MGRRQSCRPLVGRPHRSQPRFGHLEEGINLLHVVARPRPPTGSREPLVRPAAGPLAVGAASLLGSYQVLRAAHPLLRRPGAVVINVSAPQASLPMGLQAHVCGAKAGVDMLTRVLAIEWGGDGIRVNSVVPGPIEGTEGMARLAPTQQARETVRATVPPPVGAHPVTSPMSACSWPRPGGLRYWRRPARRRRLVTRRGQHGDGGDRRPVANEVGRRFRLSSASTHDSGNPQEP